MRERKRKASSQLSCASFARDSPLCGIHDQHWGWNVDVKKLWLRPNWTGTLSGTTPLSGKVSLDPWLIGTGITYKF